MERSDLIIFGRICALPIFQVAIVTGASSGIGLATVHKLLEDGCAVLGVDIAAAADIKHEKYAFHQIDLAKQEAPDQIIQVASSAFGSRLDILVNVAGILDSSSSVETLRDEDWDRVIAVNLTAPVRLMRTAVKIMKEQRSGSIVNVSSKAGISGAVAGAAYTASKHGLVRSGTLSLLC
jgi:NAD(P)-dependent dehydrogenase (short-subunit alcohol dehydrogenase family)